MYIDHRSATRFFKELCKSKKTNVSIVVVTHLLPDRPSFFHGLEHVGNVKLIIPKPNSINHEVKTYLEQKYPIKLISKGFLKDPNQAAELINHYCPSGQLIILDIGGYFAKVSPMLPKLLSAQLLGIVEDTENGHQKYMKEKVTIPIISAARSPLKEPEDFLIGQSIVFSSEVILREHNEILTGSNAAVIGYGKIGTSIALNLQRRYVNVVISEKDPTIAVRAKSHGFRVVDSMWAICNAEYVYCATGNHALTGDDFSFIRDGAFVFSVTSSDDELDMQYINNNFNIMEISPHVKKYTGDRNYFYLVHDGNAVNFLHNAVVGNYILLVQAELLCSAYYIATSNKKMKNGIQVLPKEFLDEISTKWMDVFSNR